MNRPALVPTRLKFASVSWSAEDVLELRPDWTRAQALTFLAHNESHMRDRLVEHGWVVLETLIAYDDASA